jgi:hypothetical protein
MPQRQAKFAKLHAVLDYGLWNDRVDALYDLEEDGGDALPLMIFAYEDADYQVRLSVVHFLGKIGPAAIPALRGVVRGETCPYVRLFGLRQLAEMGPAGVAVYNAEATAEDREYLASLPRRYTPSMMGRPLTIDAPFEMNKQFFNGGLDTRQCKSSEHAGRLHGHRGPRRLAPADREPVETADVPDSARKDLTPAQRKARAAREAAAAASAARPPRSSPEQKKRDAEIDSLLSSSSPSGEGSARARRSSDDASSNIGSSSAAGGEGTSPSPSSSAASGTISGGAGSAVAAASGGASYEAADPRALALGSVPATTPSSSAAESSSTATRKSRPGETLPLGPAAPDGPSHLKPGAPFYEAPDARSLKGASVAAVEERTRRPGENLPLGPAAPAPRSEEAASADFVPDAGTGKIENDPIPVLIAALSAPDPRRRCRAADELGRRGGLAGQAVPALRKILRDKDRRVRSSAALALGSIGGASNGLMRDLRRALRDKDEDVRFSAAMALERLEKLR